MSESDEHFTDENIENFFKEVEPIATLLVNKHTLDILTNHSVITMLCGQLLTALNEQNKDEVIMNVHALHGAFVHAPTCYDTMNQVLEELWDELFNEDYIEHLYGADDDSG